MTIIMKLVMLNMMNKFMFESRVRYVNTVLLSNFSCHILRHGFTTRLCEVDVNPKSMQVVLGHSDIRTTLQIYADVTEEHKQETFNSIEDFFRCIL